MNQLDQAAVLLIGATGYIGGTVLVAFLQKYPEFQYVALVRKQKDNAALEAIGVRVLQGSTSDVDLVEKASSEVDIVVNCADADDVSLADAIIKGLMTRASKKDGSRKPIYIHTSGTGVVMGEPVGEFRDIKIYDDSKEEDIRGIDPKQPHRNVDLQLFAAGDSGRIDTYIVAPSTIYGKGLGPVRQISKLDGLIRLGINNQQVLTVGAATNVWDNVHIEDLADLYLLILDLALNNNRGGVTESAYARFFWGSAGTHAWGDVARDIASKLYKKGLVGTEEVKPVTLEEHPKFAFFATNSRTVANRGVKSLGWKPSRRSLKDSLDEEIDMTLTHASDDAFVGS